MLVNQPRGIHQARPVLAPCRLCTQPVYSENGCTHSCEGYPCGFRNASGSHGFDQLLARARFRIDRVGLALSRWKHRRSATP